MCTGGRGGGPYGGVVEKGGAVVLAAAFPPVAVDGGLQLARRTEATPLTLVGVQVLHVPGERGERHPLYSERERGRWSLPGGATHWVRRVKAALVMEVGRWSPLVISLQIFLLITSTKPPFSVTSV